MASLKEIKARIASVNNTLKITSAMKMVASAKLHRVQNVAEGLAAYSERLADIAAALTADPELEVSSPLASRTRPGGVPSWSPSRRTARCAERSTPM